MTDEQLNIVQGAAQHPLLASENDIQVGVITEGLSPEQASLVIGIKMDSAHIHLRSVGRALKLKALRDSFFPKGMSESPNQEARMGWADFLRREFDVQVPRVNYEIAAVEAGENAILQQTHDSTSNHGILNKLGSSHLEEIGRGATPAIRRKVWDSLFDGEMSVGIKPIRSAIKRLNSEAGQVQLKAAAPPKAPAAPKLPTRQNSGQGQGMSVSKWTAEGTPQGDRMEKEFAYLAGAKTGNETFQAAINGARKGSSRSGKITRMQVLAAALHAECKAVSDRYQLENEKARDWKRYMTVWQHHWSDTDQLDMAASLKQIASEMAEASRHFEIMGQLSWSDKVRLEE